MTTAPPPFPALPDAPSRGRARRDGHPVDLPAEYTIVARALARYLRRTRAVDGGRPLASVRAEVGELLEQAAFDGAPIRRIVGPDAAEFAWDLARNHGPTRRDRVARERLEVAIGRAEARRRSRRDSSG
ncbi:DUF1048 domain-containing protein [Leifsonia sp. NPDC080035]|uniref:DUF1048 domain-containing protein n=1 Tax=Leifsonia sp. NPDC080035 TaxID=3143936 RepID=A0AAU7GG69_9MICO